MIGASNTYFNPHFIGIFYIYNGINRPQSRRCHSNDSPLVTRFPFIRSTTLITFTIKSIWFPIITPGRYVLYISCYKFRFAPTNARRSSSSSSFFCVGLIKLANVISQVSSSTTWRRRIRVYVATPL